MKCPWCQHKLCDKCRENFSIKLRYFRCCQCNGQALAGFWQTETKEKDNEPRGILPKDN